MSDIVLFRHKHHWDILAGKIIDHEIREIEKQTELMSEANRAFDAMFNRPLEQLEELL